MVEELISGNTEFVEITSNFEYVIGQTIGRALSFKADFEGRQWEKQGVLDAIAMRLERRAKEFAEAQGIRNTGNLIDNIRAYPDGSRVHLKSEARKHSILVGGKKRAYYNPKSTTSTIQEGYYGGHVEFGHKTSNGGFYPARPYLRPALRVVSEESKGEMIGTIQAMFSGAMAGFDQRGVTIMGRNLMFTGLTFGRNFSYRSSPTHELGLSKLSGYTKGGRVSKEQRSFSRFYSAQRGAKGSTNSRIAKEMGWSGRTQRGSWVRAANREKTNPNKGLNEARYVKDQASSSPKGVRNPDYKQTWATRSMGSHHANTFYHNQAYQQKQEAKANTNSKSQNIARRMSERGLLRM